MEKNYKHEQTTAALRRINNVKAAKILEIKGNSLIIRRDYKTNKTVEISVSNPQDYKVNEYIDVILYSNGTSSYGTKFLGRTPGAFIPADGAELGF